MSYYDPIYYELPYKLRELFDSYSASLMALVADIGPDEPFDVLRHEKMADAASALKKGTRFGKNMDESSQLESIVKQAIGYAKDKSGRKGFSIDADAIAKTTFYTCVPSIQSALNELLLSMIKNTEGKLIRINGRKITEGDMSYEIRIEDDANACVPEQAGRRFAHGKLRKVLHELNGLCEYTIEAVFNDGKRYDLDMVSGEVQLLPGQDATNFVHILRFP